MTVRVRIPVSAKRSSAGFTLVETLMALVILVILTGVVAMAITPAFKSYTSAVDASNAQILLSTTTAELRSELGLAQAQQPGSDGVLYYKTSEGYWASLESTDQGIEKHVYLGDEPGQNELEGSPTLLVSKAAQTDSLRVRFSDISYGDGVFAVNGLQVVRAVDGAEVACIGGEAGDSYKILALMLEEGR